MMARERITFLLAVILMAAATLWFAAGCATVRPDAQRLDSYASRYVDVIDAAGDLCAEWEAFVSRVRDPSDSLYAAHQAGVSGLELELDPICELVEAKAW